MHAFDGRAIYAERALDDYPGLLYFSLPPSIVRTPSFAKLARRLPLDRLLLESDAPALAAVPQTRNEPAELPRALHMLAGLKGLDVEHVRQVLLHNSYTLFPRLRRPSCAADDTSRYSPST